MCIENTDTLRNFERMRFLKYQFSYSLATQINNLDVTLETETLDQPVRLAGSSKSCYQSGSFEATWGKWNQLTANLGFSFILISCKLSGNQECDSSKQFFYWNFLGGLKSVYYILENEIICIFSKLSLITSETSARIEQVMLQ